MESHGWSQLRCALRVLHQPRGCPVNWEMTLKVCIQVPTGYHFFMEKMGKTTFLWEKIGTLYPPWPKIRHFFGRFSRNSWSCRSSKWRDVMKSAGRCEEKGCHWCQDAAGHYCFCQALEPSRTDRRRSSWSTMDEVPCPMWRWRPASDPSNRNRPKQTETLQLKIKTS